MSSQRFQTVTVHSLGIYGEGVASLNGYTLFIPGALPSEVVEVEIQERHQRYGHGSLIAVKRESPERRAPSCPLFGQCGGCQLMHLAYERQLEFKRQRVIDALVRIGKIADPPVLPCTSSPTPLHYRNKIHLPVREEGGKALIGLYRANSHSIIEVQRCAIHHEIGESVYQKVKTCLGSAMKPYDPMTGKGELRSILIRSSMRRKEALVAIVTRCKPSQSLRKAAKELIDDSSFIKGIVHHQKKDEGNFLLGEGYTLLEGRSYIEEEIDGLSFNISPQSFFQVHLLQAERLYRRAIELAELTGKEVVVDGYCGVGTLALLFAKHVRKVIGIECIAQAVRDGEENGRRNGIHHCEFREGFAELLIPSLEEIDLLLLNPPRKGCALSLLEAVGKKRVAKILYISCDPATLARDLAHLMSFGYRLDRVEPFDMFPQTAHVETLVKLTLST